MLFASQFTIEGWVYSTSVTSWCRLMDFGNGANQQNVLFALSAGTNGVPIFQAYQTTSTTLSVSFASSLPLNVWVHLAASFSGSAVSLYMNGVASGSGSGTVPNSTRSMNYVGHSEWSADGGTTGFIDDFRIWSVARTQAQVAASMNQSLAGNEAGLQLYYRFDEASGATVAVNSANSTGSSLNGAITSATTYTQGIVPLSKRSEAWLELELDCALVPCENKQSVRSGTSARVDRAPSQVRLY